MPSPRLLAAALAGAALGLVACNQDTVATRCRPVPTPSPPVATAGQLTATTDAGIVPTGGAIDASVKVAGPLSYQAPCDGPLSLIVIDRTDIHVDSLAPPALKGTPCGAVSLAAGQSAEYDVLWSSDPSLPPGPYRLVLSLGDQPQLVLSVRLGYEVQTCR